MYEAWNWPTTTAIVGLNALGWFLLGVTVGRKMLRRSSAKSGRQPARTQQPSRAERGAREAREERGVLEGGGAELYVGNLSYETTEEDLRNQFGKAGKVVSVRLIENKFNGKSKGYAFLEMDSEANAMEASRQLNGKEFKGRKMVVSQAKSKAR